MIAPANQGAIARAAPGLQVLLTTTADGPGPSGLADAAYRKILEAARLEGRHPHRLVDDPAHADLILFAETEYSLGALSAPLRRHPFMRQARERIFVYSATDRPIPLLPGIYTSLRRRDYHPERTRTGHYLSSHLTVPPLTSRPHSERRWLFSFVGDANTAEVRGALLTLQHPDGLCRDVSSLSRAVWARGGAELKEFVEQYGETLSQSRFALCPRGIGTGSIRLFEAMRAGCAPVILADEWIAPEGPDWASFSLRVKEAEAATIPALLARHAHASAEWGRRARQAWEDWFSDEASFRSLVTWCAQIQAARQCPEQWHPNRAAAYLRLLRADRLRRFASWLRACWRNLRKGADPC